MKIMINATSAIMIVFVLSEFGLSLIGWLTRLKFFCERDSVFTVFSRIVVH